MKKIALFSVCLLFTFSGICSVEEGENPFNSPGKTKLQEYFAKSLSSKYMESFDPEFIRNNRRAEYITLWYKFDNQWTLREKAFPKYIDGTNLISELENHLYNDLTDDYIPMSKIVAGYDEKDRIISWEIYSYNDELLKWDKYQTILQAYDHQDEVSLYEFYLVDFETGELILVMGYKAVDVFNENNAHTERTWNYYTGGEWIPEYRESFVLNENDIATEMLHSSYDEYLEEWVDEIKYVFTINDKQEWSEALLYMKPQKPAKPIYLLGNGTEAGWDNTKGLEMIWLGGGEFGIIAQLRKSGDLIKFISNLGQWAPQWGYGGDGDASSGTLSYRFSEAYPDPPAISIASLTPGEYVVLADTAYLTYITFPYSDPDKLSDPRLKKLLTENEWILTNKFTDIEWFDFSKMKPLSITLYRNENINEPEFKDLVSEEPVWIKSDRNIWSYHQSGMTLSEEYQEWVGSEETGVWVPNTRDQWTYDELLNLTSELTSRYMNGSWVTETGYMLDFRYKSDGSVLSYVFAFYSTWENEFEGYSMRMYNYQDHYSLSIVVNPINAGIVSGHGSFSENDDISLNAVPASGYNFISWAHSDGSTLSDHNAHTFKMPGFNVVVVANFGVQVNTHEILTSNFNLFPNPAWEHVTVTTPHPILRIMICDITGKIVLDHNGIFSNEYQLTLPDIKPGIYLARIITEKEIKTCKLQVVSK